jgi:Asp/Glu/hydantoin racemase
MVPATKKLLMVIPVNTSQYNDIAKAYVAPVIAEGFTLDVVNITRGFPAIQSRFSLEHNATHVAELIGQLFLETDAGYDGVFVSDFDGCGVDSCRELLSVPVVDAFAPQACIALSLAQTFSIITPSDTLVGMDIAHPRQMGLTQSLASVRPMNVGMNELDKTDEVIDHAFDAAVAAITHDGAQAILLGCSALMNVADPLAKRLADEQYPVPVMDPNLAAVGFLQMLVRCGWSQSPLCFPTPPEVKYPAGDRQIKPRARPRASGVIGE